ncbi:MAG: hypothetical protein KGH89_08180 [Thaumarchaeota archaeon]|nr:hypothetical protein [Nitrososphaerota archaeon]MDE1866731.1 hypothetical protein [Nitrososphaerota archaeon]
MKTFILLLFLTGSLMIPMGLSSAESEDQSSKNNSASSQYGTLSFVDYSSATGEGIGQQTSDFVHKSKELLKEQRQETLASIKETHAKIHDTSIQEKKTITEQRKNEMTAIKEKSHTETQQFQTLFKDFRNSVIELGHGKGSGSNQDGNTTSKINNKASIDQILSGITHTSNSSALYEHVNRSTSNHSHGKH